jgi:hypothetical protein
VGARDGGSSSLSGDRLIARDRRHHHVMRVAPRPAVEAASARDQRQGRPTSQSEDPRREPILRNEVPRDHPERVPSSVRQPDTDRVSRLELTEPKEDPGPLDTRIDVPHQERGSRSPGRRAEPVPPHCPHVAGDLHGPGGLDADRNDTSLDPGSRDRQLDRRRAGHNRLEIGQPERTDPHRGGARLRHGHRERARSTLADRPSPGRQADVHLRARPRPQKGREEKHGPTGSHHPPRRP